MKYQLLVILMIVGFLALFATFIISTFHLAMWIAFGIASACFGSAIVGLIANKKYGKPV